MMYERLRGAVAYAVLAASLAYGCSPIERAQTAPTYTVQSILDNSTPLTEEEMKQIREDPTRKEFDLMKWSAHKQLRLEKICRQGERK